MVDNVDEFVGTCVRRGAANYSHEMRRKSLELGTTNFSILFEKFAITSPSLCDENNVPSWVLSSQKCVNKFVNYSSRNFTHSHTLINRKLS